MDATEMMKQKIKFLETELEGVRSLFAMTKDYHQEEMKLVGESNAYVICCLGY